MKALLHATAVTLLAVGSFAQAAIQQVQQERLLYDDPELRTFMVRALDDWVLCATEPAFNVLGEPSLEGPGAVRVFRDDGTSAPEQVAEFPVAGSFMMELMIYEDPSDEQQTSAAYVAIASNADGFQVLSLDRQTGALALVSSVQDCLVHTLAVDIYHRLVYGSDGVGTLCRWNVANPVDAVLESMYGLEELEGLQGVPRSPLACCSPMFVDGSRVLVSNPNPDPDPDLAEPGTLAGALLLDMSESTPQLVHTLFTSAATVWKHPHDSSILAGPYPAEEVGNMDLHVSNLEGSQQGQVPFDGGRVHVMKELAPTLLGLGTSLENPSSMFVLDVSNTDAAALQSVPEPLVLSSTGVAVTDFVVHRERLLVAHGFVSIYRAAPSPEGEEEVTNAGWLAQEDWSSRYTFKNPLYTPEDVQLVYLTPGEDHVLSAEQFLVVDSTGATFWFASIQFVLETVQGAVLQSQVLEEDGSTTWYPLAPGDSFTQSQLEQGEVTLMFTEEDSGEGAMVELSVTNGQGGSVPKFTILPKLSTEDGDGQVTAPPIPNEQPEEEPVVEEEETVTEETPANSEEPEYEQEPAGEETTDEEELSEEQGQDSTNNAPEDESPAEEETPDGVAPNNDNTETVLPENGAVDEAGKNAKAAKEIPTATINTGLIVGAVVGSIALILLITLGAVWYRRRKVYTKGTRYQMNSPETGAAVAYGSNASMSKLAEPSPRDAALRTVQERREKRNQKHARGFGTTV